MRENPRKAAAAHGIPGIFLWPDIDSVIPALIRDSLALHLFWSEKKLYCAVKQKTGQDPAGCRDQAGQDRPFPAS